MTFPNPSYPSTTGSWQCPNCKQWVTYGNYHGCTVQPTYPPMQYAYADNGVFERIAVALEKLVKILGE
jgi:hypothetical protein